MKRAFIYAIANCNNTIDKYIYNILTALKPYAEKIYFSCPDSISVEDDVFFQDSLFEIIDNNSDCINSLQLYKRALEFIYKNEKDLYDEVVLLDDDIMGPVNSVKNLFSEMSQSGNDYWSLTEYYKEFKVPYFKMHFIAFRKRVLECDEFVDFWKRQAFEKEECQYEKALKKILDKNDLKWDIFVKTDDVKQYSDDPFTYLIEKLVAERSCPFFSRSIFGVSGKELYENTSGRRMRDFFCFLKKNILYDTDLILESLLKTENQEDLVRNFNFVYTLNSKETIYTNSNISVALVMHIYYEDLIDKMLQLALNMPVGTKIFVTVIDQEMQTKVFEKATLILSNRTCDVRVIENRGRDVSSLLVGVKDVIFDYDLVCFIHDKKTPQIRRMTVGEDFAALCYENTLGSVEYVENIIGLFSDNKRLGLAYPPLPDFGPLYNLLGNPWGPNYDITLELARKLDLQIPISKEKKAMAPYGTCFWFRPQALRKLYEMDWNYSDFPEEPNKIDGTILHAVERIYPLVAQDAGYYPGMIMTDEYAGIEYNKLTYYLSEYNKCLFEMLEYDDFAYVQSYLNKMVDGQSGNTKNHVILKKEAKGKKNGLDYLAKDILHKLLPRKIFVKVINFKRKKFGPFVEYSAEYDERYK